MALTDIVVSPEPCRCRVCDITSALSESDRTKFLSWLNNETISGATISRHMRANGHRIAESSIKRWRSGIPTCRAAS